MRRFLRLTQGAYSFLSRQYKSVLLKCFAASLCCFMLAAPVFAAPAESGMPLAGGDTRTISGTGLPKPGSSFTVKEDMVFSGMGDISYGGITCDRNSPVHSMTLEDTRISAARVEMERIDIDATNSSLISAAELRVNEASLADSVLESSQNLVLSGPLRIISGSNRVESLARDIYLGYGASVASGASLVLRAADEISGAGSSTYANTDMSAAYVTFHSGVSMSGGRLDAAASTDYPSVFNGTLDLKDMDTSLGIMMVMDSASISGGAFEAKNAQFYRDAKFDNVETSVGEMATAGETSVSGGSFKADSLLTGKAVFSAVSPKIGELTLKGPLSLLNGAELETSAASLGSNSVSMDASSLKLSGDFTTANLSMKGSTLAVEGAFALDTKNFELDGSGISAKNISMADFASTGSSSLSGTHKISTGAIDVRSGRLAMQTSVGTSMIKGGDLRLHSGASASLQSPGSSFNSISGNGSLDAHNLRVVSNLDMKGGSLYLTGSANIGGDMSLSAMNASVEDLTVEGEASINASSVTGRNISFHKGATLDNASTIEARNLKADAEITLLNDAQILAGNLDLGSGGIALEGAPGERVIVATGEFGNGDLLVDANSMLSIGSSTPNWVNMGMDGHKASAALGLWTPFQLGSGATASVGAGMGARSRALGDQVNFGSNSLLITNATVASREGAGAISSLQPAEANVEAGAKLHILDAQKDGLYRVLGENLTVNYYGDAWQNDNVRTDSALIKLERLGGDKLGWFQARAHNASDALPGLDPDLGGSVDDSNNKGQIPPEPDSVPRPPASNRPDTPVTPPDAPVTPPDTPVTPPDTPITPPDTPVTPPDTPVSPPDRPVTPPDTPDTPVTPPDTPDTPVTPPDTPDAPVTPPDTPDTPVTPPDTPDTPDKPTRPWTWTPSYTPGQKFLSRAVNFWFIGHDRRLAARTIESAGRIYAIGAAPDLTLAANSAASRTMASRTGLNNPAGLQGMNLNGEPLGEAWHGFAMWIAPLYKSLNSHDLTAGHWSVDKTGGLGGVAIGADYTFENALRLGLSFNVGGGYAQGGGDLADTRNNMSFWGLGAYAGWSQGNFDIAADVAFTSTYNKLRQELPSGMRMDDLKSDITVRALSAGLEFAYTLPTGFVNIRPHAGARYLYLYNDSYTARSGGAVLDGKAGGQNIWTFPIGLTFEKEFRFDSGWHLRPTLDFSVIPAAGDKKIRSEVRFTGTDSWATLKDQFMDDITYRGSLGLEFGSGNFSLGLNYSIEAGMKTSSQTVMGMFAYEF